MLKNLLESEFIGCTFQQSNHTSSESCYAKLRWSVIFECHDIVSGDVPTNCIGSTPWYSLDLSDDIILNVGLKNLTICKQP